MAGARETEKKNKKRRNMTKKGKSKNQ